MGVRSGFEARIQRELLAAGVKFLYESEKLAYIIPASSHVYTPDFIITTTKSKKTLFIETKGWFKPVDRKKHLLVRDSNPNLDIRFVFQNPNARISKNSKTTYAKWCDKNGFIYAKGSIPPEWINE